MGWRSVPVVLGCRMVFCSGRAGCWDAVLLRWCWVVRWRSVVVVLSCGMAFCRGGAGL